MYKNTLCPLIKLGIQLNEKHYFNALDTKYIPVTKTLHISKVVASC